MTENLPQVIEQTSLASLFEAQKRQAAAVRQTTAAERIVKLKRLQNFLLTNKKEIAEAVFADFKKPLQEVWTTEVFPCLSEIRHTAGNLKKWMRPKSVGTPLSFFGASSKIYYESKGSSLIIAPWNYPFFLAVSPLISAIAAGNTVMIKPSEMTPHTSAFIRKMIADLFSEKEITVVEGGVDVSTELLSLPFDHIFFTGSPAVGKIVMAAAAKHLTSVTLELGGKSPAVVDESANLKDTAEKLTWGKFLNNGQTCVAPDYLLVQKAKKEELLALIQKQIGKFYNPKEEGIQKSPAYARIVNERHFGRINDLLQDAVEKGAKILTGGQTDHSDRYISPCILTDVRPEMRIMQEEIFGPILPVITYDHEAEATAFINSMPKPLAMYIFSANKKTTTYLLENTSAGGSCVNDCVVQFGNHNLPTGGVNNSGIGKAHGHYGFLEFSNSRSVMKQRTGMTSPKMVYPPYTKNTDRLLNFLMKYL